MNKQDKIGAVLRKVDYLWTKKGNTFCDAIKEVMGGDYKDQSDDDIINNIKNISPDEKSEKD